jgi:hypothetical protein
MKPIRNKVLLSVNLSQTSDFEYITDGGLELWGNKAFGFDNKITAPVLATVVNPGTETAIKVGDTVVCHHNSFNRNLNDKGDLFGDTGEMIGKESVFALESHFIYFRLDDKGNPHPLSGYVVAERIPMEYDSNVIIPDSVITDIHNQFKWVSGGDGLDGILITYTKSDVTVNYTYKKKQKSFVRIKVADILATSTEVYYG